MKKTDYQKPTCEILVVRFEENIMSPNNSWSKNPVSSTTWGAEDDDNGME